MDLFCRPIYLSFLAFLSFSLICLSAAGDNQPSAYEALQQYNFPIGLLPMGVTNYDLNPTTGGFSAHLNGTCSFRLENSYELNYKSTIKGVISESKIKNLIGISVKVVLLWLNVVEVRRNGEELEFSVGIASANFPVSNFEECPQCGCGLDCGTGKKIKVELNRFVSSS